MRKLLVVAALLWPQPASADRYLEDSFPREGLMLGFAFGPGAVGGEQRGAGGAVSLRIGTSAGERLQWLFQIDSVQFDVTDSLKTSHSTATVAGQYYVREVFWLKAGIGTAGLTLREMGEDTDSRTRTAQGLGLSASGGLDIARFGTSWAVGLESGGALGIYDDGVIVQIAVGLAFTRY